MYAENIILCGLYVGPSKPKMKLRFEPIIKRMEAMSGVGISINTPDGLKTIRAKFVFGTFDLPAKALVLCAKQYNGEFGCSVCLHPGKQLDIGTRVYLPNFFPEHDHDSIVAAAEEAQEYDCAVDGVMKKSPFTEVLDLVNCFPIDYMHVVLEGVVKC